MFTCAINAHELLQGIKTHPPEPGSKYAEVFNDPGRPALTLPLLSST